MKKCRLRLGVNIDHVATLRQARGTPYPDPLEAARLCERAGAHGITVHLREDRRHIQDRDLRLLRETVQTRLNLEMGLSEEIIGIALKTKPDQVTLVPEKRQELTTEGGLNVVAERKRVAHAVKRFRAAGIEVSLFIDPDAAQITAAKETGATIVELHTGVFANAAGAAAALNDLRTGARLAANLRLSVAAGHGLTYRNVRPIVAVPEIEELNIGHSIVSRAVLVGMERAVREMKDLLRR